jgi:hypothetical protein
MADIEQTIILLNTDISNANTNLNTYSDNISSLQTNITSMQDKNDTLISHILDNVDVQKFIDTHST